MGAITGYQQVAKRGRNMQRKASLSGSNNKSAGFASGFMSQFSQKPVRIKSRKTESFFKFTSQPLKTEAPKRRFKAEREPKAFSGREKPRGSGFSIPLPSAGTLAIIAGTVLIALAALKWDDLEIRTPENFVFQPAAEDTVRQTMQYAATGISSLALSLGDRAAPAGDRAEKNPTTEPENPQEALISFEWQQYKVRKGDSVSLIAKNFNISLGAIIASNDIRNAKALQEGTILKIPNIDGIPYSVKKGDNLSKISTAFNVPLEVILDVNDIKSDNIKEGETLFIPGARMNDIDLKMSLGELFIYPVQSRYITSKFGMRKDPISGALNFHTGIDLRGNTGAPVVAAMEGTVSVVSENWLYGKYVILSHGNGFKTLYGHLSSYAVKQGDKVARGKKIAEVGNTGYSTGSHLHFTIYDKNGKLVNPLELLK